VTDRYVELSRKLAKDASDFIRYRATRNRLGLVASRFFWSKRERWSPVVADFDDIGDILLFIGWYGTEFGDEECLKFARDQIELWVQHFRLPCGLFVSEYDLERNNKVSRTDWRAVSLYEHHDALLGIVSLYRLTDDELYLRLASELADVLLAYVRRFNGLVPNKVIPALKLSAIYTTSFSLVCGVFAEELAELYTFTGRNEYLGAAERIIAAWTKTTLFQKAGLFAIGYHPYLRHFSPYPYTELMKPNTNMVYVMLYLYDISKGAALKESIYKWFSALAKFRAENGGYYGLWDIKKNRVKSNIVDKTQNFAVIDAFLEAYRLFGEKEFLARAEECARFWLGKRQETTRLIPEQFVNGNPVHFGSKIDQNADLYTMFLKLYELTGKEIYLDGVREGLEVFAQYHRTQSNWWHRLLDCRSGQLLADSDLPPGENPAEMNVTKYVGGPLRFFINANKVLRGQSIYADETMRHLVRDR